MRSQFRSHSFGHRSLGDRFFGGFVSFFVAAVFILVIGGFVYSAYDYYVAEKFSLRKDEFACTASHIEEVVSRDSDGHTSISHYTVCDQYTRKG